MENKDSLKKELFKKDIFEAISEEFTQSKLQKDGEKASSDKNDLNKVLITLKQSIDQLEGDLNGETNEFLKDLSVILCEKMNKTEPEISPPMLLRQDTFIISTNERLFGQNSIIEDNRPTIVKENSLYEKISEAFENFNINNKVIVVLVEPDCHHVRNCIEDFTPIKKSGLKSSRPMTSLATTSTSSLTPIRTPKQSFKPNRSHSINSLNVNSTPRRVLNTPSRKGFITPNQSPKLMNNRSSVSSTNINNNRRNLSPCSSVRSSPLYTKQNQITKSASKIPTATPQKSKMFGSVRNLTTSASETNTKGKQNIRPVTRAAFPSPSSIYGNKNPFGPLFSRSISKKKL